MVEKEVWKDINGYNGFYQVSNLGRIKNYKNKLLSLRKKWNGYIEVQLFKAGQKKHFQIHRLVAETFLENPNNLPVINHKNEIKFDNRLENLEWCTNQYNINYKKEEKIMKRNIEKDKKNREKNSYEEQIKFLEKIINEKNDDKKEEMLLVYNSFYKGK